MRGSEDDPVTLSSEQVAVRTEQLVSATVWLIREGHKAGELQMDTGGFLHVFSGDERAAFALDGTDA